MRDDVAWMDSTLQSYVNPRGGRTFSANQQRMRVNQFPLG